MSKSGLRAIRVFSLRITATSSANLLGVSRIISCCAVRIIFASTLASLPRSNPNAFFVICLRVFPGSYYARIEVSRAARRRIPCVRKTWCYDIYHRRSPCKSADPGFHPSLSDRLILFGGSCSEKSGYRAIY